MKGIEINEFRSSQVDPSENGAPPYISHLVRDPWPWGVVLNYFEDSRTKKKKSSGRSFVSVLVSICIICLNCFVAFAFGATIARLVDDEVKALQEIAESLGKKYWDFNVDPCSGKSGWMTATPVAGAENAVTCNCYLPNSTFCHGVSIVLKSQGVPGVLPRNLEKLPHLQEIDLSRNYINGTIPAEWVSLPLVNIALLGNRLSGQIPKEFGNITTLRNLILEANQLSGPLPPELGSLVNIERMYALVGSS
ncbi:hypothetical protein NE237_032201 [Protea cynaroides]|uniref:Uncharacterized protein n=1 Tax=Protea cynaroides TaxID=273540 RepID=A0A9Q0L2V5_9MAGN|nr:hypothetical protein NE237_032201 [Protea cynaroides]